MYSKAHLIGGIVLGLLLGGGAVFGVLQLKAIQLNARAANNVASMAAHLPACKEETLGDDQGLLKRGIAWDTVTIPALTAAKKLITNATVAQLYSDEIARETSELAKLQALYAKLYGSAYTPTQDELQAVHTSFADSGTTDPAALAAMLRGFIEHQAGTYYAFLLASSNQEVKALNASFLDYRSRAIEKLSAVAGS